MSIELFGPRTIETRVLEETQVPIAVTAEGQRTSRGDQCDLPREFDRYPFERPTADWVLVLAEGEGDVVRHIAIG